MNNFSIFFHLIHEHHEILQKQETKCLLEWKTFKHIISYIKRGLRKAKHTRCKAHNLKVIGLTLVFATFTLKKQDLLLFSHFLQVKKRGAVC